MNKNIKNPDYYIVPALQFDPYYQYYTYGFEKSTYENNVHEATNFIEQNNLDCILFCTYENPVENLKNARSIKYIIFNGKKNLTLFKIKFPYLHAIAVHNNLELYREINDIYDSNKKIYYMKNDFKMRCAAFNARNNFK